MNKIFKLEQFTLEEINLQKDEHLKWKKHLQENPEIETYLGKEGILESQNISPFLSGSSYFPRINNELVGYISISKPVDSFFGRACFIHYAIDKQFRGKNYATKLLQETSNYLFEKEYMDIITLDINKDNQASIKVAEKAGYKQAGVYDDDVKFIQENPNIKQKSR